MITAAELDALRADAEREMPDLISIFRHVEDVLNEQTLVAEPVYETIADNLPAFIVRTMAAGQGGKTAQGERPLEVDSYAVHTTADLIDIKPSDLVIAVHTGDPKPIALTILSDSAGSATGTRRLTCERIGDGITLPVVVIEPPTGFGLAPFGTAEFGV